MLHLQDILAELSAALIILVDILRFSRIRGKTKNPFFTIVVEWGDAIGQSVGKWIVGCIDLIPVLLSIFQVILLVWQKGKYGTDTYCCSSYAVSEQVNPQLSVAEGFGASWYVHLWYGVPLDATMVISCLSSIITKSDQKIKIKIQIHNSSFYIILHFLFLCVIM